MGVSRPFIGGMPIHCHADHSYAMCMQFLQSMDNQDLLCVWWQRLCEVVGNWSLPMTLYAYYHKNKHLRGYISLIHAIRHSPYPHIQTFSGYRYCTRHVFWWPWHWVQTKPITVTGSLSQTRRCCYLLINAGVKLAKTYFSLILFFFFLQSFLVTCGHFFFF